MTQLWEPVVEVDKRADGFWSVDVDGTAVGFVAGRAEAGWTAGRHAHGAPHREFPTKALALEWLLAGCPTPAGRCPLLRPYHPHVLCIHDDGHAGRHHFAEPLSAMGREMRRRARRNR